MAGLNGVIGVGDDEAQNHSQVRGSMSHVDLALEKPPLKLGYCNGRHQPYLLPLSCTRPWMVYVTDYRTRCSTKHQYVGHHIPSPPWWVKPHDAREKPNGEVKDDLANPFAHLRPIITGFFALGHVIVKVSGAKISSRHSPQRVLSRHQRLGPAFCGNRVSSLHACLLHPSHRI